MTLTEKPETGESIEYCSNQFLRTCEYIKKLEGEIQNLEFERDNNKNVANYLQNENMKLRSELEEKDKIIEFWVEVDKADCREKQIWMNKVAELEEIKEHPKERLCPDQNCDYCKTIKLSQIIIELEGRIADANKMLSEFPRTEVKKLTVGRLPKGLLDEVKKKRGKEQTK